LAPNTSSANSADKVTTSPVVASSWDISKLCKVGGGVSLAPTSSIGGRTKENRKTNITISGIRILPFFINNTKIPPLKFVRSQEIVFCTNCPKPSLLGIITIKVKTRHKCVISDEDKVVVVEDNNCSPFGTLSLSSLNLFDFTPCFLEARELSRRFPLRFKNKIRRNFQNS
jgi:hypothetical protein